MTYKFEVGVKYAAPKATPVMYFRVIKKTNCFVWLDADDWGDNILKKKICYDVEGNEYVKITHKDYITLSWDRFVFAKDTYGEN